MRLPAQKSDGSPIRDENGHQLFVIVGWRKAVVKTSRHYRYHKDIARLSEQLEDMAIRNWIADDKAQAVINWQNERKALHVTNERRFPLAGQFSGIGKYIFYTYQPEYYFDSFGISVVTFKPFVKVRVASSYVNLHVDIDISKTLRGAGKNARRKAIRYGKVNDTIADKIHKAVEHYLNHQLD